MAAYGMHQVSESDQGTRFIGTVVQGWAEENNAEWRFHLPYNLMRPGFIKCHNGILKAVLKTDSQSLQGWTKRLYETLQKLNERPKDSRSSALKMPQTTWASPLRIQITGTDNQDHWEEQHDIKMLQCHCKISVTTWWWTVMGLMESEPNLPRFEQLCASRTIKYWPIKEHEL